MAAGVARLDDEDVGVHAARDARARRALAAGVAAVVVIDRALAVQRLREREWR